jgi:hypothetical protein
MGKKLNMHFRQKYMYDVIMQKILNTLVIKEILKKVVVILLYTQWMVIIWKFIHTNCWQRYGVSEI